MNYPTVTADGVVTHVMLPIAEYERLRHEPTPVDDEIAEAIAIYENPATVWHDGNDVLPRLITDGIEALRKEHGLTQAALAENLELSQSQISRMERDTDSVTLGTLKRIAAALTK